MNRWILTLFLMALVLYVPAQRICGTVEYSKKLITHKTPSHTTSSLLQNKVSRDTAPGEIIIIPVVIHVLYNTPEQNISKEQILSQLQSLNNDFARKNADAVNTPSGFMNVAADCGIQFCLARVDPSGRNTSGIVRKHVGNSYFLGDDAMKFTASGGSDGWDSRQYLNIWVCNLFGRSLGYATLPGGPADNDGVVINYDVFGTIGNLRAPFNKGRTATHEVAHWLGLYHIWGDQVCGDDGIPDTPPQKSYNYGCPSFPRLSNCSINGNGDMFMNFMDFSNDECMNMFTIGQKTQMRGLFALNHARNMILDSYACDSTLATGAPLPEDTTIAIIEKPGLKVYPNPVTTFLTLEGIHNDLTGNKVEIFNLFGQKVHVFSCHSNMEKINISFLPPGSYILKVVSNPKSLTAKIIKL